MAKSGRPTDYSPEVAEAICEGIAEGLLLSEVCKRPGMPSPATIYVWLLIAGAQHDLRIPCARETMQSIRDSVHQLLEDQIQRLGLQADYEVQKAEIIGRNGTSFTFLGLRDQSVHNIKSLEGADILW
jgi:hypothetical protein